VGAGTKILGTVGESGGVRVPRVGTCESIDAVAVEESAKGGGLGRGIDLGADPDDWGTPSPSFFPFSFSRSLLALRVFVRRCVIVGDDDGLVDSERGDGLGGE
jgi:hypothetical protein